MKAPREQDLVQPAWSPAWSPAGDVAGEAWYRRLFSPGPSRPAPASWYTRD
jgi:hypothetical protein